MRFRREKLSTERLLAKLLEIQDLPTSLFRTMATKKACPENAFIARYPTSAIQMFDKNVDLNNFIYLSE